jgi:pimeloyl-ACP methyl ester carboxylesterase
VLFNSGSVHNVGPHRIYVTLARDLAARGFACFRFDLEGIGDSVRRGPGRENHPYPDTAIADALTTLSYLKERFGFKRFIAMGICSGAHTAFHAALHGDQLPIAEIVLINPLTFRWVEGLSLSTSVQFADMASYRRSARDSSNWMRLLRGKVGIAKLSRVALTHMMTTGKAHMEAIRDTLFPALASQLSRDLNRLFAIKCQITVVLSDGEPGRDILLAGAKRTASRAFKTGQIRVHAIPKADHTFSQSRSRRDVIARLNALLSEGSGESR